MSKNEYLKELGQLLKAIPLQDRNELLADYSEHFTSALEAGKQESEIIEALGNPKTIAKEIIADFNMQRINKRFSLVNVANATFAIISLGFLNLVIVLGPLIGFIAVLVALVVVALVLIIAAPIGMIYSLGFSKELLQNSFLILMSISIGVLLSIGLFYLIKWLYKLFIRYLQFNLQVVRRNNR
ncbi:DUF1700 domain-containing protein [Paenibacillus psychroresistens]|uniref:DUF1700 domain-containing protein n=1 Tax=Paenibacillus psychroresistens TaxID=1778678 RepID=A0A6B8RQ18_9BACL|nr:DUF1700 domain-containing protein [Paenibacillus psychroresistens]QGQ97792.1 DUF1700 domain-containing protein [Paenibacillus psychroresistens]